MLTQKQQAQIFVVFLSIVVLAIFSISIITLVRVSTINYNPSNVVKIQNNSTENPNPVEDDDVLNILPPATLSPKYGKQYQSYKDYSARLRASVNTKIDPCNDFYAYSCGNVAEDVFSKIENENFKVIIQQLTSSSYIQNAETPVKYAAIHYNKCVESSSNWEQMGIDGERVTKKLENLKNKLAFVNFPAISEKSAKYYFPTPQVLSEAIVYLSYYEFINTLYTITIEHNWKRPTGSHPYALFVDQSTLTNSDIYYTKTWHENKNDYFEEIKKIIKDYGNYVKVSIDEIQLNQDVTDILNFELFIARKVNTDKNTRRNYERSYNLFTAENATRTFQIFNFTQLFAQYNISNSEVPFVFKEPEALKRLGDYLATVAPRTIYNYFYYRLLYRNYKFLPKQANVKKFSPHFIPPHLSWEIIKLINEDRLLEGPPSLSTEKLEAEKLCFYKNAELMPYANGRVFLDVEYPNNEDRLLLKNSIGSLVDNIIDAFQGMILQLDWMSQESKQGAFNKIQNIVKNIAYPELMINNTQLNSLYADLTIKNNDSYTQIVDQIREYKRNLQVALLNNNKIKDIDQMDFLGSISSANAWYFPPLNSINLPLGILKRPFFDLNYPAAVNFGGIGVIIGHELTHAFDDGGVQRDGTGVLNQWMDSKSQNKFNKMAECVVDQYGRYEPLPDLFIDGKATLGENIADNGGIQAAYRAFDVFRSLNGADPQLPDSRFHSYTQEQLFFLNFAQVWCSQRPNPKTLKDQLLNDSHSPGRFRVLGTLKNTPAFRNAFNCPIESEYAPKEHCKVWVSKSKQVEGISSTTTLLPSLNISTKERNKFVKYQEAAAGQVVPVGPYSTVSQANPENDRKTISEHFKL